MLKLPKIDRAPQIGTLAAQRPAWASYLLQRRRRRIARGSFSPASVSGLRLWLKADALALSDNTPVASWTDSSSSGNAVGQSTAMKKPTFKANILNGLPVVRFDGIDDTLVKLAASGFACTQGHTVVAVLNPTTPTPYGMAVVTHEQYNEMRQSGSGGYPQWLIPTGLNQVEGLDDLQGVWSVWTGTYLVSSSTLELFINGASQGTLVESGTLAVTDIFLGSRAETYHWLGDMAEVLVFDAALSTTDRQNVENYLIAKYALV